MIDRERKVDVSKMKQADVDNLSVQIGAKVTEITEEAAAKINAMLSIYGMSAKIGIVFNELPVKMEKAMKPASKRTRKTKQDNLK